MVKAGAFVPTFNELMVISFFVFAIDLVVVSYLVKRAYVTLSLELEGSSKIDGDQAITRPTESP
jgi:hypothetical protein